MFLGTVVYAIVNSVILALMAIGFNLTFGISGVANFAYGALYIFSAYASWMLLNLLGLPYFISAVISILLTALLGALMYRFVLLRVRGQALSEVIATFGIGLAILELFRYLGFVGFEYNLPVFIDQSFLIAGTYIDMQRILIVIIGVVLVLALWVFTHHTSLGLPLEALPRTSAQLSASALIRTGSQPWRCLSAPAWLPLPQPSLFPWAVLRPAKDMRF